MAPHAGVLCHPSEGRSGSQLEDNPRIAPGKPEQRPDPLAWMVRPYLCGSNPKVGTAKPAYRCLMNSNTSRFHVSGCSQKAECPASGTDAV